LNKNIDWHRKSGRVVLSSLIYQQETQHDLLSVFLSLRYIDKSGVWVIKQRNMRIVISRQFVIADESQRLISTIDFDRAVKYR